MEIPNDSNSPNSKEVWQSKQQEASSYSQQSEHCNTFVVPLYMGLVSSHSMNIMLHITVVDEA